MYLETLLLNLNDTQGQMERHGRLHSVRLSTEAITKARALEIDLTQKLSLVGTFEMEVIDHRPTQVFVVSGLAPKLLTSDYMRRARAYQMASHKRAAWEWFKSPDTDFVPVGESWPSYQKGA